MKDSARLFESYQKSGLSNFTRQAAFLLEYSGTSVPRKISKSMKIEALHKFHDMEFSKGWAERFTPTPDRLALFETILQRIREIGRDNCSILELGIGPGYLADYLLNRLPNISYEGLDFSEAMLKIAENRLGKYTDRVVFTQADLTKDSWVTKINQRPKVVVSTWALHDLFSPENIEFVYQKTKSILLPGGLFLNGDFIKPETSTFEYEGGRIKPSLHLSLLKNVGFQSVLCLKEFETNVENPTPANNYACFEARN